jgi:acyl-coenzyme A synthetase/AMP-(fatty) acid ligase
MSTHLAKSDSPIAFLREIFDRFSDEDAIIWRDQPYRYEWLHDRINHWSDALPGLDISSGAVVLLDCDFSPNGVALLFALIERGCIIVPVTAAVAAQRGEFATIAKAEVTLTVDASDEVVATPMTDNAGHEYYEALRQSDHAGLVLFSSGSTGKSKAAVHDFSKLLNKFKSPRRRLRAITFLLFDHIGGINTLLYTLSNGGCVVTVDDRNPENIFRTIERFRVELLPVSPTFLSLSLLDGAHTRHDISSLNTVTYGTEPMPESTLKRFGEACPHVTLQQTYGLSEVGILRSRSKDSKSLWMKVGGGGFETRVVDGILHIKAESAMMGYLNAPSPFTADGWMNTGDSVEVDGAYIKVLGRQSESINVGGEKVHPAEVESVIQEMPNVAEVTVYGAPNAITGNIVCARVRLREPEDRKLFRGRLKNHCRDRMAAFKIPVKIATDDKAQFSARFKKRRADHS